jgi:uncharacterized protein (DUF362 family)/ferredoxin
MLYVYTVLIGSRIGQVERKREEDMVAQVSIAACSRYDHQEVALALRKVLEPLGGLRRFVSPGERVLLKPNLLSGKPPEKCVTTQPFIVRTVAERVREVGGTPVVGDSPSLGSFAAAARRAGILQAIEEIGVEWVNFDEVVPVEAAPERRYRSFEVAAEVVRADKVISLPKIKTHAMMYLTLAVKNLFGCLPGMRKANWHLRVGRNPDNFARMLVELSSLIAPVLHIVDGVTIMEGNGPGSGDPRHLGVLLAGTDPVALDRVIVEMLSVRPESVHTLPAARDLGIGETDLEKIDILGEDLRRFQIKDLVPPRPQSVHWGLPNFMGSRIRAMMTVRPVIDREKCIACGRCAEICAAKACTLPPGEKGRGGPKTFPRIDLHRCIRCFCCQEICPQGAIRVGEGWALRILRRARSILSG